MRKVSQVNNSDSTFNEHISRAMSVLVPSNYNEEKPWAPRSLALLSADMMKKRIEILNLS